MAGIETKTIQEMDDQIGTFKKFIETAGEEGRNKLKSIKVDEVLREIPRKDGKVDTAGWDALGEDKQQEVYQRLVLVRDALHAAAELDGPTDPKHIMYAEYASNTTIVIWTIIGFFLTAGFLIAIIFLWDQATGIAHTPKNQTATTAHEKPKATGKEVDNTKVEVLKAKAQSPSPQDKKALKEAQKTAEKKDQEPAAKQLEAANVQAKTEKGSAPEKSKGDKNDAGNAKAEDKPISEGSVLTMVILLGALGGSLHLVSSLVMFIGNRQLKRSWLPYYLAMPFTGAGLAPVVYMLLRVGLISPSGTATGGTGLSSLNFIAIYAFAVMTGLFSRAALDKLGEVFGTIFKTQTPPSKDALGPKKPPSGSTPDAGKSP